MKYAEYCALGDIEKRASALHAAHTRGEPVDLKELDALMLQYEQGSADLEAREDQVEIIERVDPDNLHYVCWPCTVQDGKLVPKPAPRCNRVGALL